MENKLGLIIILLLCSGGLLLANNFFGFQKLLTGHMVNTGTINMTILPRPTEETPTVSVAPSGGVGGSTFGGKKYIKVEPEKIKILLKETGIFKQPLKITNIDKNTLQLSFDSISIRDLITFSEDKITLNPNEIKSINLIFQSKPYTKKGVYTGKILIKNNNINIYEIPTIIEIETTQKLFDLTINILPEYKTIRTGDNLPVLVTIFDIMGAGKSELNLEYQIKDFSGNIISDSEEVLTIENQISFTKLINIPEGTKPGEYIISIILKKGATVSTVSQIFTVSEKPYEETPLSNDYLVVILIILIIVLFVASLTMASKLKNLARIKKTNIKSRNLKNRRKV